ncbi:MAG: efflux transporter outer membrane subunit [Pseudooceanicola nanhaiensis]
MARIGRASARLCKVSALLAALAGCDQAPRYDAPLFPFLKSYSAAPDGAPVLLNNVAWWQRMKDPVLDGLIDRALAQNLSLELARERVISARAAARAVPGAASLSGGGRVTAGADVGDAPDLTGTAELELGWILDPWGGRRSRVRAAEARAEAAEAGRDAAQLLMLLNLGQAYVDLRYRERLLVLREQERARRLETLSMMRTLAEAQEATRLQVTRSRARVADIEAALPTLRAEVTAKRNEIAVLTGQAPGTLTLPRGTGQPVPALSPEVGIPADLLRNRPDIRAAEREYYAAVAEIGEARAALFPSLSLTGTLSVNALGSSSGSEYFFGPALTLPALPQGPAKANIERRQSLARQSIVSWKSTVLDAILEVENALVDYRAASFSVAAAERAARLNRETLDLTLDVLREGDATLGDLIDAEQALAAAEQTRAETVRRLGASFVALNVRLGAGHTVSRP